MSYGQNLGFKGLRYRQSHICQLLSWTARVPIAHFPRKLLCLQYFTSNSSQIDGLARVRRRTKFFSRIPQNIVIK